VAKARNGRVYRLALKVTKLFNSRSSWEIVFGLLIGICVVAAGVWVVPLLHLRNSRENQQVVVFEPQSFDFGSVSQFETVKREYRLINRGTNELRVLGLRTTCQCTVAGGEAVGKIIAPKEALIVPVEFHSTSQHGVGAARIEALLEGGGQRYYARAFIRGVVEAEFEIEPPAVDFGSIKSGEKKFFTVQIIPLSTTSNLIVKLPESTEFVKMVLHTNHSVIVSKKFELDVILQAPLVKSSQLFCKDIKLTTTSQRMPMLTIPVKAMIRPELEIAPDTVVLSSGAQAGSLESRFTIGSLYPSKVVRASVLTKDHVSKEVPAIMDLASPEDTWDVTHVRRIANSLLTGAEQVDFELEIRDGTARPEARSVSVQIKSL
jgi:hypothetical protein